MHLIETLSFSNLAVALFSKVLEHVNEGTKAANSMSEETSDSLGTSMGVIRSFVLISFLFAPMMADLQEVVGGGGGLYLIQFKNCLMGKDI